MKCNQIRDILLTDAADGTLTADKKQEMESHLSACTACREFQARLTKAVLEPLRRAGEVVPPEDVWLGIKREIMAGQIRAEQSPGWFRRFSGAWQPVFRPVYAAVAVSVLLIASAAVYFPYRNQQLVFNYIGEQAQTLLTLEEGGNGLNSSTAGFGTSIEEYFL